MRACSAARLLYARCNTVAANGAMAAVKDKAQSASLVGSSSRDDAPLTRQAVRQFASSLAAWGRTECRQFQWRRPGDPFGTLLAEVLLQRTPAWKVEPVWQTLIARYPEPELLAAASTQEVEEVIRPLGLVSRAARLIDLASQLARDHSGHVPRDLGSLKDLPGVGPYVASAVRVFAFGERELEPDGVTTRVVKRFFGMPGDVAAPDNSTRNILAATMSIDCESPRVLAAGLIDVAHQCCKPVVPRCTTCPLRRACRSEGRRYKRGSWRTGQVL